MGLHSHSLIEVERNLLASYDKKTKSRLITQFLSFIYALADKIELPTFGSLVVQDLKPNIFSAVSKFFISQKPLK